LDECRDAAFEREVAKAHSALLRLKAELAQVAAELKLRRLFRDVADRRLRRDRKAGFNPDQPRVPAGNPDGGQWTSGGGQDIPSILLADVLISPPNAFDIVPGLAVRDADAGFVLGQYTGQVIDDEAFTSTAGVISGAVTPIANGFTLSGGVLDATVTNDGGQSLGFMITVPPHVDATVMRDGADIKITFRQKT
jgi:hypothetical protein